MSPDDVRDKTITVTWEAEEISSGAFRQDNGDHVIKCYAERNNTIKESIITVKGKLCMITIINHSIFVAPSSFPSNITVVSVSATTITVNWAYGNTSDTDGYVVYVNDSTVHNIIGSNNTSVTLDGLIPGASYSITVRAYQDILGPPSDAVSGTTDKCSK